MYLYSTRRRDGVSKSDAEESLSTQEMRYLYGQAYNMAAPRHDSCLMSSPDNEVGILQSSLDTTQGVIDLCDFDVHQDIDLLAASAHHDHQGFHQTSIYRHLCPRSKQYSTKFVMDFPMYTASRQSLESKDAGKCFSRGPLERIIISQASWSSFENQSLDTYHLQSYRSPRTSLSQLFQFKVQINLRSKIGLCLLMGLGVV